MQGRAGAALSATDGGPSKMDEGKIIQKEVSHKGPKEGD